MESKFEEGDVVAIVNYGHPIYISKEAYLYLGKGETIPNNIIVEDAIGYWIDMQPNIVGKIGIIKSKALVQEKWNYSLANISEKISWYNEGQLEKI